MLLSVRDFINYVDYQLNDFIDSLISHTGRNTPSERLAWSNSLTSLARSFKFSNIDDVQLLIPEDSGLIPEYRLPSSSSYCDIVLLGAKNNTPVVLIIELKDWNTSQDKTGPVPEIIIHKGSKWHHPSDQVRGYTEYIRRFHSTVQDYNATTIGCVLFTNSTDIEVYRSGIYKEINSQYPVFKSGEEDFGKFLNQHLEFSDIKFAEAFSKGFYKQDRNFIKQLARNILNNNKEYVLLDEQRRGFVLCREAVLNNLSEEGGKSVVIVKGPPGSGKSVLAINLWTHLAHEYKGDGNIVFTTTSGSQKNNWEHIFERVARNRIAHGVVMPANKYNPGLSPTWTKIKRDEGCDVSVESWRDNLDLFYSEYDSRTPDNLFVVSIVDEAHALIDPTVPGKRGIPPSGWSLHAGPQAWHIIRSSKNSVFFMDADQSYRDNETTSIESIKKYALEFGASLEEVDLSGSQFRCDGSIEYINWVDNLIELNINTSSGNDIDHSFNVKIFDSVFEMEENLRSIKGEVTKRLLSSYSVPWSTKNEGSPHDISDYLKDFYLRDDNDPAHRIWSRVWNFAPNMEYNLFIQAPFGSCMADDPLCEVGCPYVVRGFDFDYVGLLWMDDLVWRRGKWHIQKKSVFETAWSMTRSAAKKGFENDLEERVKRSYRILLTRAIKGIYIWIKDPETREYVKSRLNNA